MAKKKSNKTQPKQHSVTHENWMNSYQTLVEFMKKHKRIPKKGDDAKLYTWCAVQRLRKKKGQLKPEYEELLNKIGFIWHVQDYLWEKNFELLVQYRKEHPERWPSQRSRDPLEHKLAVWFLGIRKDYKNGKLAEYRIKKLESIGFPFYPREYRWMNTFKKVKEFIKKHKRLPQKANQLSEEGKLYNWLKYQVIKMHYEVLDENLVKVLHEIDIKAFTEYLHKKDNFM